MMKVKIVFRWWGDESGPVALFIDTLTPKGFCQEYAEYPNKGFAYYPGVINNSRPATPEEYQPLKNQLELLGYEVEIAEAKSIEVT
jgi:hypothetical protein